MNRLLGVTVSSMCAAGLVLATPPSSASVTSAQPSAASQSNIATKVPSTRQWRKQMLTSVNKHRASHGAKPLRMCATLTTAAQDYAVLSARKDWQNHTGPDGLVPMERAQKAGYVMDHSKRIFAVGENLAWGYPSVTSAFRGWVNSPGHNALMLDPDYTDLGLGYARWTGGGRTYDTTWVLLAAAGGYCKPKKR